MQANYGENEIKSVLQKVKIFNKNLGDYQLFAITDNFDYVVKLSNGKITIKIEELQDDQNDGLTPEHLTEIANRFVSSTPETKVQEQEVVTAPVNTAQTTQQTLHTPKQKSKGLIFISIGAVALIILIVAIFNNSNSSDSYTFSTSNDVNTSSAPTNNNTNNNTSPQPPRQKTEEELKQELYQKEASNPLSYLTANYTWKVNIAANTILEGHVSNSATMAGFKNVTIKASFYSKTGVLLGEEKFTVMEFVKPGRSVSFRHKITGWWKDATNSKYVILAAEAY